MPSACESGSRGRQGALAVRTLLPGVIDQIDEAYSNPGGLRGIPTGFSKFDEMTGGFGALLVVANEWANRAKTLKSFELLARYVMPRFQGSLGSLASSRDWAAENRPVFIGEVGAAILTAIGKHNQEQEARQAVD